jgi:hypothetical protein
VEGFRLMPHPVPPSSAWKKEFKNNKKLPSLTHTTSTAALESGSKYCSTHLFKPARPLAAGAHLSKKKEKEKKYQPNTPINVKDQGIFQSCEPYP